MLSNNKNRKSEGFTIIEVLIVLAIAGLILLIVFLAVPALQRNARNTTTKSDVSSILGGFSDYEGANSGALPAAVGGTGTINYTGAAGTNPTSIKVQGTTKVSQASSGAKPKSTNTVSSGAVTVYLGYRCDGSASSRAVSAEYAIETTGNAAVYQCQDS